MPFWIPYLVTLALFSKPSFSQPSSPTVDIDYIAIGSTGHFLVRSVTGSGVAVFKSRAVDVPQFGFLYKSPEQVAVQLEEALRTNAISFEKLERYLSDPNLSQWLNTQSAGFDTPLPDASHYRVRYRQGLLPEFVIFGPNALRFKVQRNLNQYAAAKMGHVQSLRGYAFAHEVESELNGRDSSASIELRLEPYGDKTVFIVSYHEQFRAVIWNVPPQTAWSMSIQRAIGRLKALLISGQWTSQRLMKAISRLVRQDVEVERWISEVNASCENTFGSF